MDEIVNRVKESGLISIDLATYKPKVEIVAIDVADVLWQRLVLKEKDFRDWIKNHDWSIYASKAVYVFCSEDAIVPTWAYMLIGSQLEEVTPDYIIGSKLDLQKRLIQKRIEREPLDKYKDGRIIIKGCADISSPEFAMSELVRHLQPVAKSIMYGEPCSTVPVFKRK
ncbi:MAG: DUF2480 family protein [Crocinitomicaceae bacterium]|jgi:hypothetical protein|nr:DUF2480 family protein [Crocinitomicaceae bacterium]